MSVAFEVGKTSFSAERTLFATIIRLGFVTILITQEPIIERLVKMLKLYKLMKSGGEGMPEPKDNFAEMACADVDSPERKDNVSVLPNVPHRVVKK